MKACLQHHPKDPVPSANWPPPLAVILWLIDQTLKPLMWISTCTRWQGPVKSNVSPRTFWNDAMNSFTFSFAPVSADIRPTTLRPPGRSLTAMATLSPMEQTVDTQVETTFFLFFGPRKSPVWILHFYSLHLKEATVLFWGSILQHASVQCLERNLKAKVSSHGISFTGPLCCSRGWLAQ